MKSLIIILALAVFLCGCNQKPDPRVAQVEARVKALEQRLDLLKAAADQAEATAKIKEAVDANTAAINKQIERLKTAQLQHEQLTDAETNDKLAALDEEKARRGDKMSQVEYVTRASKIKKAASEEKFTSGQATLEKIIEKEKEKLKFPASEIKRLEKAVAEQERRVEQAKANEQRAK